MSLGELAETLKIPEEQVQRSLEELMEKGVIGHEPDEEGEERYFLKDAGFHPRIGISGEVQVVALMIPQVEALKRARRLLGGRLFFKEEEVVGARFSYLPLWRVEASRAVRKLFVLREMESEVFYVHAQTGTFLSLEGRTFRFGRLVNKGMQALRDLDKNPDVVFHPELPSHIEDFPEVKVGLKQVARMVERTFGAQPGKGELVLFPVWTLTVCRKDTGAEREIAFDGATGRIVVEDV
jgi:hypothetical protein